MRLLRKSARARLSDMRKPNLTCEEYLRLSLGAGVQASRQGGLVPAALCRRGYWPARPQQPLLALRR